MVLSLSSCGFCNILSKQFYYTGEGGVRPGKNKFELAKTPYLLKEQDLIKTNAIYQFCYSWNEKELIYQKTNCNHINAKISFIRFFKNGRFLMNDLSTGKDSLEQYNNLKSGKIGYYKIEEKELILEYYSVSHAGMASDCGKYYKDKYKLTNNGIQLQAERRSNNGLFFGWTKVENAGWYLRKNIKGLEGVPSW
ncbi:hypothetical protein RBU60_10735 [Mesonia sp. MT50]|uniref:Uncharacterized protein n=1 Tax=Mesonia profundi TaxID=3070998 RepID=A0ABU1A552_9FLAO|nr:hypothetical protein [Mesonia profundi]MDQ7918054.1 hypothetical protein [Mesonia profundi]